MSASTNNVRRWIAWAVAASVIFCVGVLARPSLDWARRNYLVAKADPMPAEDSHVLAELNDKILAGEAAQRHEETSGSLIVGTGVNSDAGVVGQIVVDELNFERLRSADARHPKSASEAATEGVAQPMDSPTPPTAPPITYPSKKDWSGLSDRSPATGAKEIQLGVTPRIIIGEEEPAASAESASGSALKPATEYSRIASPTPPSARRPDVRRNLYAGGARQKEPTPGSPGLPSPYYLSDDVRYYADVDSMLRRDSLDHRLSTRRGFDIAGGRQQPPLGESEELGDLNAAGRGPGESGDKYDRIYENPFVEATGLQAVSTFSIDVDTASYSNVRQFLNSGRLPPPDAVRLEELINYFDYDYAGPEDERVAGELRPFAAHLEIGNCPWAPTHRLVRIGVKGRELAPEKRPLSNLVFLIDVSGSMQDASKLPLVVEGMKALTKQLGENDRVAIVVYASSEGLALPSTPGDQQEKILAALDGLAAGGSTAGGAGIQLAYQIAEDHFIKGGSNRVILCTDGDFNVGTTSTGDLERMVVDKAKETGVFLSVCGFGRGNLNDAMMETISGKGNGAYYYIDSPKEAQRVFVKGLTGTLVTIAKDVKIQVEFNPAHVAGYRLLGYENRMLAAQDFNDDKKDAGEIGAGHTVTALYEVVPAGEQTPAPEIDELKYQVAPGVALAAGGGQASNEILTLKMRYKAPDGDTSTKREWPLAGDLAAERQPTQASADSQWAAAVAGFGMLLRGSEHAGGLTFDAVEEIAQGLVSTPGFDPEGEKAEFVELVRKAKQLSPKKAAVQEEATGSKP